MIMTSDGYSIGVFLLDPLHKSVIWIHDQILCHGFHEFARIIKQISENL